MSPEEIRSAYLLRGVNVARYSEDVRRRATGLLESLVARVYRYLLTADLTSTPKRERALGKITSMFVQHYESAEGLITAGMVDLVRDESRFFKSVYGAGSGKLLLKREAKTIVSDLLIDGTTLEEWMISQAMGTAQKVSRKVRLTRAGATAEELVAGLFGRNTGRFTTALGPSGKPLRVPIFQGDGLLQTTRRHLNTVAKSAVLAAQQAGLVAAAQRSRRVEKLELSVVLDQRTSEICTGRAGSVWMADTGQPAPESATTESFPGPPPYHLNCRSMLIPYTEAIPSGQITLEEWISSLDAAQQRRILGPMRYNSWKEGKLDLRSAVDLSDRPLTFDQLEDSY